MSAVVVGAAGGALAYLCVLGWLGFGAVPSPLVLSPLLVVGLLHWYLPLLTRRYSNDAGRADVLARARDAYAVAHTRLQFLKDRFRESPNAHVVRAAEHFMHPVAYRGVQRRRLVIVCTAPMCDRRCSRICSPPTTRWWPWRLLRRSWAWPRRGRRWRWVID